MTAHRVRNVIGILVVACFVLVTVVIALTPVLGGYPPEPYTEHLKTWAALYSGGVGAVIGFYFGRSDAQRDQVDERHAVVMMKCFVHRPGEPVHIQGAYRLVQRLNSSRAR